MRKLAAVAALTAFLSAPAFAGPAADDQGGGAPASRVVFDPETTYRLYRQTAEKGDVAAQVLVGNMYLAGEGVRRDFAEAARWYRRAAEHGSAEAQYGLGTMYTGGQGVARNDAEAASWYRKAAEQGHVDAQFDLAGMYEAGQGVPRDSVLAYMWFDLSSANFVAADNRRMAAESRDRVALKMTPAQIAEAQRLAREWKPKKEK